LNPQGTITAAFGRHYEVELDDGRLITGYPRGKKSPHACGDRVELTLNGADQGQIVDHLPRQSLLYRSDAWKQKMIAANATQIILVVATEPAFYDDLLSRALAAAEHENLRTLIILNKCDLAERVPAARDMLAPFAALGYPILELSARDAAAAAAQLRPRLQGQISVLVGQSGMGKSTLINALLPEAKAATREISAALDSGKHTTTHARLYRLDTESAIIDSPGLQEFGLAHLSLGEIEHAFLEMRPYLGQCRFRDCRHENEPDCAIKTAVAEGRISPRRLEHFLGLLTPTRSAS
jgi:ribosome biogenesis GTPase